MNTADPKPAEKRPEDTETPGFGQGGSVAPWHQPGWEPEKTNEPAQKPKKEDE